MGEPEDLKSSPPKPKGWKSWMPEPKAWKSWLPEPKGWKSWLPKPKAWKSWTPEPKGRRSWMSQKTLPNQGVVKQDWVATGRIDFATTATPQTLINQVNSSCSWKNAELSKALLGMKIWKFSGDLPR